MTRSRTILPVLLLAAVQLAGGRAAELELLSYEDARATLRGVFDSLKAAAAGVSRSKEEAHAAALLGLPGLTVNATEVFGEKTGKPAGDGPRLAKRRVSGECASNTLGPNLMRT
jgi:hypothetical protein